MGGPRSGCGRVPDDPSRAPPTLPRRPLLTGKAQTNLPTAFERVQWYGVAGLSAGNRVGPYEMLAPLGAGGMGEVWKARDTRLDRVVALKFSRAQFSERFEREARAIAALNHPNIAQIYDVGENYLVMEFVEGAPLRTPEDIRQLLDMALQIADGLSAAHAAGIVHRDLKSDNMLITK